MSDNRHYVNLRSQRFPGRWRFHPPTGGVVHKPGQPRMDMRRLAVVNGGLVRLLLRAAGSPFPAETLGGAAVLQPAGGDPALVCSDRRLPGWAACFCGVAGSSRDFGSSPGRRGRSDRRLPLLGTERR